MMPDSVRARVSQSRFWRAIPLRLILVMVVGVAIRLAYVVPLDPAKLSWQDERDYDRIAWRLAQTGQFQSSTYDAPPVLPAFLAIVYRAFGHDYRAARIAQALLSALLILAMFRIADIFFNRKAAYLTALGVAFYPQFVYLSSVF